jgi:hypothetical protein
VFAEPSLALAISSETVIVFLSCFFSWFFYFF